MGLRAVFLLLVLLNLTDNVIGSWLHSRLGNSALGAQILYVKYLVIVAIFLGFCVDLIYGAKLRRYEWFGIAYLIITIVLGAVITVTHPQESAGSRLYLYMFPVVTYFAGHFFGSRADFGIRFTVQSYAVLFLTLALVFALLNLYLGAIPLWRDYLDYSSFVLDVKGFTDETVDGLHGNFFYTYAGQQIPRFIGSFGDPLALAYAGMILVVPVFSVVPKYRWLLCTLIAVVVAASLTRAVFLFLPVAGAIYWYFGQRGFTVTLALALVGVALVLVFGDFITTASDNSSTSGHVLSISQVFDFLNPETLLGGAVLGGKLPEFEPGLFNILFLFGIGPFVLFVLFLRGIYLRNSAPGSLTPYVAILMLVGLLTLAIISSVFFATTSAWFAWFLAGFASKRSLFLLPDVRPTPLPLRSPWAVPRQGAAT
jgi:hypothetical protein